MSDPSSTPTPLEGAPLTQRRVQGILAVIAIVAVACMVVATGVSKPQHNAIDSFGETVWLRIDLNRADVRELTLLPGVGPVLAARIIDNRDRLGEFHSVSDLDRVRGIGRKTIERLGEVCEVRR